MSAQTSTPSEIIAGDSIAWTITLDDYPASDGYVLSYALVKSGALISITSSASDDDHAVSISATTTAGYSAGIYDYQAYVTLDDDRYTVETGTITVKSNFATQSSGLDTRSHAKKMLDAIDSLLEGKSVADVSSYSIAGRSLTKYSPTELMEWRKYYAKLYLQEQRAAKRKAGKSTGSLVKVQF